MDIPEPQGRSLHLPVGPNTLGLPEDYVPWSKVIYLDAGFGSLQLAELLAQRYIHCVMGVKQIDKYFPKQALYDLMEHAEAGAVVEGHEWKSLTVKQFANILASQLVNNELSGCSSGMDSSGVVADETLGDESEDEHIPAMYDKKRVRRSPMRSGKGKKPKKNMYFQVQRTCSVCTKKTAYFCGHRHCGERFPICSQHLRAGCLKAHRDDYKSRTYTGQSEIELFARQPAKKKYKTQRGRRRTTS